MIRKTFTSRGYNYHLLDHIQFGDKYYSKPETFSSEYLLDCLNAGGVLRIKEGDEFYFYISPFATADEVEQEVRQHLMEDFPEEVISDKVIEMIRNEDYKNAREAVDENQYATLLTCYIITENLWILNTRKKVNLI